MSEKRDLRVSLPVAQWVGVLRRGCRGAAVA